MMSRPVPFRPHFPATPRTPGAETDAMRHSYTQKGIIAPVSVSSRPDTLSRPSPPI